MKSELLKLQLNQNEILLALQRLNRIPVVDLDLDLDLDTRLNHAKRALDSLIAGFQIKINEHLLEGIL